MTRFMGKVASYLSAVAHMQKSITGQRRTLTPPCASSSGLFQSRVSSTATSQSPRHAGACKTLGLHQA